MIATDRFLLRPLVPADVTERYCAWLDDEQARAYISAARARHTVEDLRAYVAARASREDVLFLGIFEQGGGAHVGNIKYEPISAAEHYAVMGILIGEPAWRGKGAAEEVIRASAHHLRDRRGIEMIYLGVHKTHLAAQKSYEKAGFHVVDRAPFPTDHAIALAMARETR
jgi:RimJ/RimL family protein N-acetyltransferase